MADRGIFRGNKCQPPRSLSITSTSTTCELASKPCLPLPSPPGCPCCCCLLLVRGPELPINDPQVSNPPQGLLSKGRTQPLGAGCSPAA
eukprot:scaffold1646_cov384-Prasinococcus_capsulatus_cf.AAC.5